MLIADADLLIQFRAHLKASKEHFGGWREEVRCLYDFLAGRQWDEQDEELMNEAKKPMVTFNLFAKFIDAVTGLQINNRQEIRYFPRTEGAAAVSDLATGAIKWNRDQADSEDEETDTFADLVLGGMGYVDHRLEDEADTESYIAQERIDPLQVYPDPGARKRNLSDGRFIIRIKPLSKEAYEELFGDADGYDSLSEASDLDVDVSKTLHANNPESSYEEDDGDDDQPDDVRYAAQYQYWKLINKWMVKLDEQFAAALQIQAAGEFEQADWDALKAQIERVPLASRPRYEARKIRQRCYYQAFICGDGVKNHVKLPVKSFTIKAVTGKRDRNKGTWYGIGRNIKDPNKWVNKFFSSMLWQLAVNAKGGLLAEEGAFTDPKKAEKSWADPSAITFVVDGAIRDGRVQDKTPPALPPGMERLMQFSVNALPEVSGINLELLGLADREQAARLESQRKQAAMAIIAWAFDGFRRYYKESGRLMLDLMRLFIADGRLIRIAGPEGEQYVPLLKDELTATFDIVVDEAPTSTNMKERTWAVLGEVIRAALQAGVKIPPEVLKYAPIPADLAQKWQKFLEPAPEAQQQQQQQIMIAVKDALAEIRKTEAEAALAEAKTEEIKLKAPVEALTAAAEAGAAQAGAA